MDNIEVITDEELNKSNNIVSIDTMLNNEQKIDTNIIEEPKEKDKILRIQIILLILWVILTIVIYFFGYDLFEPFIKV